MKMAYLQPTRGVFTFDAADKHVQFAEDNGMDVHGHALVWHNQNPAWLTDGTYDWTQESLLDVMKDHILSIAPYWRSVASTSSPGSKGIDRATIFPAVVAFGT